MPLMLNVTLPIAGFMALRDAIGEDRALLAAQTLERAQIQGEAELVAKIYAQIDASRQALQRELQDQLAQRPHREELKRYATHESLADLRTQFQRLDKKMTVGFLTLLGLNLASNAPTFIEWATRMVGYALR
ncbi:hypothetical protein AKG08_24280 [Achromobacter piechaudii]|uniref:Uncharacterized protein n=1 Tax=Achromobacter piechaudii TaxID=72556 RepID=A0ABM8L477_9BURK|nr:hypothetical protein [Achromobacter piechaudii]KNY05509.1 hypothetical protein AKG08_24280 [Achromobacter piechaudii]CAB3734562.1 hypothetical protein LMG1873_05138 [Achromobacter piechaudii]CAB3915234.1 hypothetical protein LMG2828_05227 [Achromobacter piechaudii]CAB3955410.1 hypothetical protein LMG6103_04451 [Achromobacter piechaudii]